MPTLIDWLLSRDASRQHVIVTLTRRVGYLALYGLAVELERLGVGYVYGRRPPAEWGHPRKGWNFREVLTLRNRLRVVFVSAHNIRQVYGLRCGSVCIFDGPNVGADDLRRLRDRIHPPELRGSKDAIVHLTFVSQRDIDAERAWRESHP